MGFGIFLLDTESSININKLDQKKRLRLDKLDKVSQTYMYVRHPSLFSGYLFFWTATLKLEVLTHEMIVSL